MQSAQILSYSVANKTALRHDFVCYIWQRLCACHVILEEGAGLSHMLIANAAQTRFQSHRLQVTAQREDQCSTAA